MTSKDLNYLPLDQKNLESEKFDRTPPGLAAYWLLAESSPPWSARSAASAAACSTRGPRRRRRRGEGSLSRRRRREEKAPKLKFGQDSDAFGKSCWQQLSIGMSVKNLLIFLLHLISYIVKISYLSFS